MKLRIILLLLLLNINSDFIYSQKVDTVKIGINNLFVPLTNDGNIAGIDSAVFDSVSFLYSAGHILTGLNSDTVWTNGVFLSEMIKDYNPSISEGDSTTVEDKFFVVKSSDPSFGQSWIDWKGAVAIGALFYDGDLDGFYDPIDLNGNDLWDENEDRPDLIGDITTWDRFLDSTPATKRVYDDVQPMGIEVRRSVFAYFESGNDIINNTVFFRYMIENVGEYQVLDSVYFGIVADQDIGYYGTDLTGCDTILQSSFAYKTQPDQFYGVNPPTFVISLLQGPIIQKHENNAFIRRGPFLGEEQIPNHKNIGMTSSVSYPRLINTIPENKYQMRNYLKGLDLNGEPFSVRDDPFGNGDSLGSEAELIPPNFKYSGDPTNGEGWLNSMKHDWRMITSTGSFTLEKDSTVELIFAFIMGRGNSPLNSVTIAKENTVEIQKFYDSNFKLLPVNVLIDRKSIPTEFILEQNYPNPFNPSTKIKYSIPSHGGQAVGVVLNATTTIVTLKIYDILGREVSELVNKEQQAGSYQVNFDASNLGSGIYFYQLRAGSFVESKKMILLK